MARILQERDIEILRKLAPEVDDLICSGSGLEYRSILPPVSRHYASDELDFARRLERLTAEDLQYLADVIVDRTESLGCMPPEDVEALVRIVAEKVSDEAAHRILALYESAEECDS